MDAYSSIQSYIDLQSAKTQSKPTQDLLYICKFILLDSLRFISSNPLLLFHCNTQPISLVFVLCKLGISIAKANYFILCMALLYDFFALSKTCFLEVTFANCVVAWNGMMTHLHIHPHATTAWHCVILRYLFFILILSISLLRKFLKGYFEVSFKY